MGDVLRLRESLPRLVERNAIAKATLSWPQQYICFQDAFRWRSRSGAAAEKEGGDDSADVVGLPARADSDVRVETAATFAAAVDPDAELDPFTENEQDFSYCVYEVSVAHSKVALARGHVRGEGELILCTVTFCANPANDLTCPPSYVII